MKKILLSLFATLLLAPAFAQSLKVHVGNVVTAYSIDVLNTMEYNSEKGVTGGEEYTLTINDKIFNLSEVDSIIIDDSVLEDIVKVEYNGDEAHVYIYGDYAPYLTTNVDGAYVFIYASSEPEEEIIYTLTGTSTNGSFYQSGSYKCTFNLSDLSLTSQYGAAINIDNGKRIKFVTSGTNTFADYAGGTQKACFYVKGHAEFSGEGTINIAGNATHAYASKEYTSFKKSFGAMNITAAVKDALHIGQYFEQKGGAISISGAQGDGLQVDSTSDNTDELNGQVIISGGSLTINLADNDDVKGIKSADSLKVSGGTINIKGTGDGQKGMKAGTDMVISEEAGTTQIDITLDGGTYTTYDGDGNKDSSKTHGINVVNNLYYTAGTVNVSTSNTKAKDVKVGNTYYHPQGVTINGSVSADSTVIID